MSKFNDDVKKYMEDYGITKETAEYMARAEAKEREDFQTMVNEIKYQLRKEIEERGKAKAAERIGNE